MNRELNEAMRGSDVLAGLCGQMARSCRKSPLGGAWQCVKASHLRARVRMDPFGTPTVKKPRPETFRKFQLCTDLRPVGQTVLCSCAKEVLRTPRHCQVVGNTRGDASLVEREHQGHQPHASRHRKAAPVA